VNAMNANRDSPYHEYLKLENGDNSVLQDFLDKKADVNKYIKGDTPCLKYLREKNFANFETLLKFNMRVDQPGNNGDVPLEYCLNQSVLKDCDCRGDFIKSAKHLLDKGALINHDNTDGKNITSVLWLTLEHSTECHEYLELSDIILRDTFTNELYRKSAVANECHNFLTGHVTLLSLALSLELENSEHKTSEMYINILIRLLKLEAIVESQDIFHVCSNGRLRILKLFLDEKNTTNIDLNCTNDEGFSPLIMSLRFRHLECAKALIKDNRCNVNHQRIDGVSALWISSKNGFIEIARLLLDRRYDETIHIIDIDDDWNLVKDDGWFPADVHLADNDGWFPLYNAAGAGDLEMCKLLLMEFSAFVNQRTKHGKTALYHACERGKIDCVKLLLNFGANPNLLDVDRCSPLHMATFQNHIDIVKLLLDFNAEKDAINIFGESAKGIALKQHNMMIIKLLLNEAADET